MTTLQSTALPASTNNVTINYMYAGLLMRPEHSETKAKTKTRQCETKMETETEKLL